MSNPAQHQVGRLSFTLWRRRPLLRFDHRTARADLLKVPWAPSPCLSFFICLQWLHSCLLAGGCHHSDPLSTPFCFLGFLFLGGSGTGAANIGALYPTGSQTRGLWTLSLLGIQISWDPSRTFLAPFLLWVQLSDSPGSVFCLGASLSLLSWVLESCSRLSCSSLSPEASGSPCFGSCPCDPQKPPWLVSLSLSWFQLLVSCAFALRSHWFFFPFPTWGLVSGSTHFFNLSSTFLGYSDPVSDSWESSLALRDLSPLLIPAFSLLGSFGQIMVLLRPEVHFCNSTSSGQILEIDVSLARCFYSTTGFGQFSVLDSSFPCASLVHPASFFSLCHVVLSLPGLPVTWDDPGSPDVFLFPLGHLWHWPAPVSSGQDFSVSLLSVLSVCSVALDRSFGHAHCLLSWCLVPLRFVCFPGMSWPQHLLAFAFCPPLVPTYPLELCASPLLFLVPALCFR